MKKILNQTNSKFLDIEKKRLTRSMTFKIIVAKYSANLIIQKLEKMKLTSNCKKVCHSVQLTCEENIKWRKFSNREKSYIYTVSASYA
jgi:hypothetical protein